MEGRAALHLDRLPGMVGEDEDGHVIGRVVSPPPLPSVVRPGTADWTEHVPAHDPCADVLEASPGEIVVNARRPFLPAVHALERTGRKEPLVELFASDAEPMVPILSGTCAVPIEGYREALHS